MKTDKQQPIEKKNKGNPKKYKRDRISHLFIGK